MSVDQQAARDFSIEVIRTLRSKGFEAYWAGGCVRDRLLGKTPKDYDVATSAVPNQIRELFGRRRTLAIGAAFGVISVLGPKEAGPIEVATFREDADYSDGRRPDSVRFTNAEQDARRRDFTINGMFFDPIIEETIDFVGGEADLREQCIRAIGDPHERIDEDKLRMLRAVRFAAVLAFKIDAETFSAVQKHAAEIQVVSAERIAEELRRMFAHPNRRRALQLLHETGLLQFVFPELPHDANDSTEEVLHWWNRSLNMLDALQEPSLPLALAILHAPIYRDQGRGAVEAIGKRLRLSGDEVATVLHVLDNEATIRDASKATWPSVQRVLIQPRVEPLVDFVRAAQTVDDGSFDGLDFSVSKLRLPEEELNPPPLINGQDLQSLGLRPGPRFREWLDAVRDEQLHGRLHDKREAIAWLDERGDA